MTDTLRILILEDAQRDAARMEWELRSADVTFTSDRVATKEAFRKQVGDCPPDVILADHLLPDLDGMGALQLAKELAPAASVIIVTDPSSEEDIVACLKAGAADYVAKDRLARIGPAVKAAIEQKRTGDEKRRAEEAIQASAQEWRATFDAISDAVCVLDRQGRIRRCNKAMRDCLGKPFSEIIGHRCPGFLFGTSSANDENPYVRAQQTGRRQATTVEANRRWISVVVDPLLDEADRFAGAVFIRSDITELRRTEAALKEYSERLEEMVEQRTEDLHEAQSRLLRQERLAAIGQLAGGLGHELRNPLGAIKNAAYLLKMVLDHPEPEVWEGLNVLEKEVATSERIIDSLLGFGRASAPIRREVNVNDLVRQSLARTDVPKSVQVVCALEEELPTIEADAAQLVMAFTNIILNAVQAMPEGGRLLLRSEIPDPKWVAITCTDTGIGVPDEHRSKIFEPLFTTKAKGIGLGLALVKALIEGHGGRIEVRNEEIKGSTFTIQLPTAEQT